MLGVVKPVRSDIVLHGYHVSYRSTGSGPVLVLLHGIAGTSAAWEQVMPRLGERYTVIAPDLLGHGDSEKPQGGHSLGGGIAMQFAYQFPDRCDRLGLVSSGGLGREVHLILRAAALPGAEAVLPWLSAAGKHGVDKVFNLLGRLGLRASSDLEEAWRGFVSLAEPEARRAFLHTVRGIIDLGGQRVTAHDRLYLADGLPTLIVWGEDDPLVPVRHAREAHERIHGSRLEVFPGAGHFPHLDQPVHFAEVLLDFLETTRPMRVDDKKRRARLRTGAKTVASA
jgi:pimeloyl-ACP methyl ester carboxylesterase